LLSLNISGNNLCSLDTIEDHIEHLKAKKEGLSCAQINVQHFTTLIKACVNMTSLNMADNTLL
jgi:hypothetical protein